MRALNYLLAFAMFATLGVFTSCTDDGGGDPPTDISVTAAAENVYAPGAAVSYEVTATAPAEDELDQVSVAADNEGVDITASGTFTDGKATVTFNVPSDLTSGTAVDLTFTVMTVDGGEATASSSFTVSTSMSDNQDGKIYHMLGSGAGAWDLVANAEKKSGDAAADKDMINTTSTATDPGEYFFDARWKAGNSTMFVKVDGFNYDGASVEAATAAYAAGSAVAEIADQVAVGDVFVAKLRGGDNYAVIKIEDIILTANNSNGTFDNNDNIQFSYKKAPANATKVAGKTMMAYH